jgi:uncharacterized protein (DUF697 family)
MATNIVRLGQAKSFWKILKEVSVASIRQEAEQPVTVALIGNEEKRREIVQLLYTESSGDLAYPAIRTYESASEEDGFPVEPGAYDIILDAGGDSEHVLSGPNVYRVAEIGDWQRVIERVLDDKAHLALPLARRFPGLRQAVCQQIIRNTSMANAEIAMLNAIPAIAPILGLLIPTAAIGDMLILGKNQAMMLYRLAAAHGLPLDYRARSKDIAPLLSSAFGWRAIGREVIGFVPGGIGIAARGAVAYAGTQALGQALHKAYSIGSTPSAAQLNTYYRAALTEAKEVAGTMWSRIRGTGQKALPAGKSISFKVEKSEAPPVVEVESER